MFSKIQPLTVVCGLAQNNDDTERRVITANFRNATVVKSAYAVHEDEYGGGGCKTGEVQARPGCTDHKAATWLSASLFNRGSQCGSNPVRHQPAFDSPSNDARVQAKAQGTDLLYRCASEFQYINRGPSVDMVKARLMVGQVGSSLGTSV